MFYREEKCIYFLIKREENVFGIFDERREKCFWTLLVKKEKRETGLSMIIMFIRFSLVLGLPKCKNKMPNGTRALKKLGFVKICKAMIGLVTRLVDRVPF